jgi:hypothetical protein
MTNLIWLTAQSLRGEDLEPLASREQFPDEVARFEGLIGELSDLLTETPLESGSTDERLLQGPIADALSHVGQLAMLRRLAGSPVPAEDFFSADIA